MEIDRAESEAEDYCEECQAPFEWIICLDNHGVHVLLCSQCIEKLRDLLSIIELIGLLNKAHSEESKEGKR